jgi:transcriptional regulator with XRE-family HTH domain
MNLDEFIEQQKAEHPGFAEEWDRLEPEYSARRAFIDARAAAGATQDELAALLGVSQPAVARMESGRHDPKLSTLIAVAEATGAIFVISGDGVATLSKEREAART